MALGIRVLGFGLRGVQGLYRVLVLRVSGFGLGFQGSGFYGFSVLGGVRVLGFRVLHVLAACVIITAPTLKPPYTLIILQIAI